MLITVLDDSIPFDGDTPNERPLGGGEKAVIGIAGAAGRSPAAGTHGSRGGAIEPGRRHDSRNGRELFRFHGRSFLIVRPEHVGKGRSPRLPSASGAA